MIVTVALFGYAALVAAATSVLRRPWTRRAPRLAIGLWQLALATIVASVVFGLLALTVPVIAGHGLATLLHACVVVLRADYRGPTSTQLWFVIGMGFAAALLLRIGGCLAAELTRAARERRRHLDALTLLGRADPQLGVTVLDHASPAAYCVPGRRRRIVLTTATLATLDAGQLASVLAHERAHLAGRHDLVLVSARALARAVPIPMFTTAVRELGTLVEMLADDAACTPQQRLTLATALVSIAAGSPAATPAAALAAAGVEVLARVRRLTGPPAPLPRLLIAGLAVAGLLAAATPAVIALGPAAAAAALSYCPFAG